MSGALLAGLIGLALVDSLNPSLFIAQLYLLTTPRPLPRVLSYIVGVVAANFLGGMLILGGLRSVVTTFVLSVEPWMLRGGELVLGAGLLLFGVLMRIRRAPSETARKPRSLQPIHTFLLGFVVMGNELTTALPYFVALERLAQAQLDPFGNVIGLLLYNGIFALPLVGFLALYLGARQRFVAQIGRINQAITAWMPHLITYSLLLIGAVLIADAAAFFVAGGPLFG